MVTKDPHEIISSTLKSAIDLMYNDVMQDCNAKKYDKEKLLVAFLSIVLGHSFSTAVFEKQIDTNVICGALIAFMLFLSDYFSVNDMPEDAVQRMFSKFIEGCSALLIKNQGKDNSDEKVQDSIH